MRTRLKRNARTSSRSARPSPSRYPRWHQTCRSSRPRRRTPPSAPTTWRSARSRSEEAAELEAEAEEAEEAREEAEERIAELDAAIEDAKAAFDEAPADFGDAETHLDSVEADREDLRERREDVSGDLQSARDRVAEAEELLDAGKCPECGQPVDGSPHVDGVEEYRERVTDLESQLESVDEDVEDVQARIERAEALVEREGDVADHDQNRELAVERRDDRTEAVEEARADAEEAREEADELADEAATAREEAEAKREAADAKREELADLNSRQSGLKERVERPATWRTCSTTPTTTGPRQQSVSRRSARTWPTATRSAGSASRISGNASARWRASSTRTASSRRRPTGKRAADYLEKVEPRLEKLYEERDDLQGRIGAAENAIKELEALREQREAVAERHAELEAIHDEVSELESMYGDLRAELRQQNVTKLERLLNETFELVYQNDSYARIELSGDYELTVYQKDGEALEPDQLSGGERALFNLSLRCAIYRLLAEGIEGEAPLPPLILDEPTVFLDSGHVSQLVELVESMRRLGVEQIVVVSHDEELVDAADDVVRVEKDATSNRSRVVRDEAGLPAD